MKIERESKKNHICFETEQEWDYIASERENSVYKTTINKEEREREKLFQIKLNFKNKFRLK